MVAVWFGLLGFDGGWFRCVICLWVVWLAFDCVLGFVIMLLVAARLGLFVVFDWLLLFVLVVGLLCWLGVAGWCWLYDVFGVCVADRLLLAACLIAWWLGWWVVLWLLVRLRVSC